VCEASVAIQYAHDPALHRIDENDLVRRRRKVGIAAIGRYGRVDIGLDIDILRHDGTGPDIGDRRARQGTGATATGGTGAITTGPGAIAGRRMMYSRTTTSSSGAIVKAERPS